MTSIGVFVLVYFAAWISHSEFAGRVIFWAKCQPSEENAKEIEWLAKKRALLLATLSTIFYLVVTHPPKPEDY